MRIRFLYFLALQAFSLATYAAVGDAWRPVEDRNLAIVAGSVLDFSGLVSHQKAAHARLFCASSPYGIENGFPDRAKADDYARQLRLHGYNLARFHFVDKVLMNRRTRDFDFDLEQLDRFHYFLAALKREGISWMMDGLTSWNAAYGDVGGDRWVKKRNVKAGVYYDPEQRKHWEQLVQRILGSRNPYTGIRILDDPALYGVILVNEGGLNHIVSLDPDPGLDRLFQQWVVARYRTVETARNAWGMYAPKGDQITLPRRVWAANPWVRDAQRFFYEIQRETFRWMSEYIRTLGYEGRITAFNNWPNLQDQATRAHLPWIAMNAYHDEPSMFVQHGSRIAQSSSLVGRLEYVRHLANSRHWGKPYSVSEHDHPFWNRWRYESGLAVGAYAALQGWDLICRHATSPIEMSYGGEPGSRKRAIYPFGIGMDPVARANETLTALLYVRGDVRSSRHRVGINLSEEYVFDERGGISHLPAGVAQLGLVTGVGLLWADNKPDLPLDTVIEPGGPLPTLTNKLASRIGLSGEQSLGELLNELRARGLLVGNQSDGKERIVSDTAEIILEPSAKSLKVITPRTEAAAFEQAPGRLDALAISASSGPALVSASAMDASRLGQSRRILLILATDARNTGMRFADLEARELVALGSLPVVVRTARVDIRLRHADSSRMVLYALHLNGGRAEKLPLTIESGAVSFSLDTATLKQGPTTFFELVVE
jgi:hypothetical protein